MGNDRREFLKIVAAGAVGAALPGHIRGAEGQDGAEGACADGGAAVAGV